MLKTAKARLTIVAGLVLALAAPACHKAGSAHGSHVSLGAGTRSMSFASSGLARSVIGQLWYPTAAANSERTMFYSSMVWGHAAPNAVPANSSKRPLILLAHGWRGTRFDLSWIGEALAREGYVSAAINMPSSDAQSFEDAQAPKSWFRAGLLSKTVDAVAKDAKLADIVDTDHVIVIGHSAGGSTALVMAGAKLDPELFAKLFPLSAPVVEGDWRDNRISAVVALNPGTGPAFSAAGLSHVHVPVLVLSGTGDEVAPEAQNAGFYAHNIEKASWARFADVDHYSFMPVCSPWGQMRGFGACIESHPNVDRGYVHTLTLAHIEKFLQGSVATDSAGKAAQAGGLAGPVLSMAPSLSLVLADTSAAQSDR